MHLSGIDLHKRDLVIGTVATSGEVVEQRRLRATPAAVAQYAFPRSVSSGGRGHWQLVLASRISSEPRVLIWCSPTPKA
jgi:hypothetical protein